MNKPLLPLALIAILAISAAAYLMVSDNKPVDHEKSLLFPTMIQYASQLNNIRMANAQGTFIELSAKSGDWTARIEGVTDAYPVAAEELSDLVSALAKAVLYEEKTALAAKYHRLGVQDINVADSQATLVQLSSPQGGWQVLVGNDATSGIGTYVRRPDEAQSFLLDQTVNLPNAAIDWLKQPILLIEPTAVQTLAHQDGSWVIERSEPQAEFKLKPMAEEDSLKYPSVLSATIDDVLNARFTDIRKAEPTFWQSLIPVVALQLSTFDQTTYLIEVAQHEQAFYLKVSAEPNLTQAHWQGLIYQVSEFTARQLELELADFVQVAESTEAQ